MRTKPNRELFGTDGIRGVAGEYPLTAEGALQVGKAVGAHFTEPGDLVLIGRDPRQSSYMLAASVAAGLSAMGVNTAMLGVVPTPGLAYLTKQSHAKAGVMITASHNPYTDNGIKVFSQTGGKLPDDTEAKLNDLINSDISGRGFGQIVESPLPVSAYEDFLVESIGAGSIEGLEVILDTANGATSGYAARVFERLGAKVTALYDAPDGRNINDHCGATHTDALQSTVTEQKAEAGAAFDGDGDRLMLVDEKGRQLMGDHIMYILALTGKHNGVAATIMTNMGLELALQKHSIPLKRTPVGDRYVMLAAIQTLAAVRASGRTLVAWHDELKLLPQKLINIPLPDKAALKRPEVTAYIFEQTKELSGTGRLNVRPSGTEPIARVMVEAPDAAHRAQAIADHLSNLLTKATV
jgi:phosphoglucosamine mutase